MCVADPGGVTLDTLDQALHALHVHAHPLTQLLGKVGSPWRSLQAPGVSPGRTPPCQPCWCCSCRLLMGAGGWQLAVGGWQLVLAIGGWQWVVYNVVVVGGLGRSPKYQVSLGRGSVVAGLRVGVIVLCDRA